MIQNHIQKIMKLSKEQQQQFYALLIHELTIVNRVILHDPETDSSQKLQLLQWVNEIIHTISNHLYILHTAYVSLPDSAILERVHYFIEQCGALTGEISYAMHRSLERIEL